MTIIEYIRRYLSDTTIAATGPAISIPAINPSDLTNYFRRYLGDPIA